MKYVKGVKILGFEVELFVQDTLALRLRLDWIAKKSDILCIVDGGVYEDDLVKC